MSFVNTDATYLYPWEILTGQFVREELATGTTTGTTYSIYESANSYLTTYVKGNETLRLDTAGTGKFLSDLTVNGNLICAGDVIQDSGLANAIAFDGSQNVDLPGGNLTLSGGGNIILENAHDIQIKDIVGAAKQILTLDVNSHMYLGTSGINHAYITCGTGDITYIRDGSNINVSIEPSRATFYDTVRLSTCADAGVDTDKFLVLDATNDIDYRTGAELLSDIGGASAADLTAHTSDADIHGDHTAISVLAGTGMSGGGTIDANVTLNCDITQYTDEMAQDSIGTILVDSASIDFTYDDGTPSITAVVLPAGVDHDALANRIHDGDTLQLDGINSDGGAFAFNTTGTVTFNQDIITTRTVDGQVLAKIYNGSSGTSAYSETRVETIDNVINLQALSSTYAGTYAGINYADMCRLYSNNNSALLISQHKTPPIIFTQNKTEIARFADTTGVWTLAVNQIIPNGGNIGSVGDTDAIAIAASGEVTLTQILDAQGGIYDSAGSLDLQADAGQNVTVFKDASTGETPEVRVYGYPACSGSSTYMSIGLDPNLDRAKFGNLASYMFGKDANNNIDMYFETDTNIGLFSWRKNDDRFDFFDDVLIRSGEKLYFRDSAIYASSEADGYLDLTADTGIRVNGALRPQNAIVMAAGQDIDCFSNGAYLKPRFLSQAAQPAPDGGEILIWEDSDDSNRTYIVYGDGGSGLKVELT